MSIISCSLITIACQLLLASCTTPLNSSASNTLLAQSKNSSILRYFNSQNIKIILYVTVFVLAAFFAAKIILSILKNKRNNFNKKLNLEITAVKNSLDDSIKLNAALKSLNEFLQTNKIGISETNKKELESLYNNNFKNNPSIISEGNKTIFENLLKDRKIIGS